MTEATPLSPEELAELDQEILAEFAARRRASDRAVGWVLLAGGVIAWIASLMLTLDKLTLLENPDAALACDINPFISCGTMINTWQASTFGIPNMTLGLGGFAILAAVGALLISRTTLPAWFEYAVLGATGFSFAFVHWLAFSAIAIIHALCPWCVVVWAVSAPMFFSTLARLIELNRIRLTSGVSRILRSWMVLSLLWWALVALVVLIVFWDGWMSILSA